MLSSKDLDKPHGKSEMTFNLYLASLAAFGLQNVYPFCKGALQCPEKCSSSAFLLKLMLMPGPDCHTSALEFHT